MEENVEGAFVANTKSKPQGRSSYEKKKRFGGKRGKGKSYKINLEHYSPDN